MHNIPENSTSIQFPRSLRIAQQRWLESEAWSQLASHPPQERSQRHWQSLPSQGSETTKIRKCRGQGRQRHRQSQPRARQLQNTQPLRVASPELRAFLACLSATLPMYWRLASSRLLRIDCQINCPTGPRSLE